MILTNNAYANLVEVMCIEFRLIQIEVSIREIALEISS